MEASDFLLLNILWLLFPRASTLPEQVQIRGLTDDEFAGVLRILWIEQVQEFTRTCSTSACVYRGTSAGMLCKELGLIKMSHCIACRVLLPDGVLATYACKKCGGHAHPGCGGFLPPEVIPGTMWCCPRCVSSCVREAFRR